MQPTKLTMTDNFVYYSLGFPTVLASSPIMKNAPSIMEDERDIKRLIETLKNTIKTLDGSDSIYNPIPFLKERDFEERTAVSNSLLYIRFEEAKKCHVYVSH